MQTAGTREYLREVQKEKSPTVPGRCEKRAPLPTYDASLCEDPDGGDSDIYVVPDHEFHSKKSDCHPLKSVDVAKRTHANVSEERKKELFYPILGVVRHVAEERRGDTREPQYRVDGCKSSRR